MHIPVWSLKAENSVTSEQEREGCLTQENKDRIPDNLCNSLIHIVQIKL